ncbi:MAG TPA: hypothetical protein VIT91_15745 [Chthoniobacterales bacterium]
MTFQRVQVSIANWVIVSATGSAMIFGGAGCQTARESTPRTTTTAQVASSPAPNVQPPKQSPAQKAETSRALASRSSTLPAAKVPTARRSTRVVELAQPPSDSDLLRNRVTEGRVIVVSSDEIIAVPSRSVRSKNDPPSLMEDAIVTSAVQTRINSDPALRGAGVKCRTSLGVVTIRGGDLSISQQAAVLNAALREQNVREVRLERD